MLLKYSDKNFKYIGKTINRYNLLKAVFEQHEKNKNLNIEKWLNLLSNICNKLQIKINKKVFDDALNYISFNENLESHDWDIDYESMILNKFTTNTSQDNDESMSDSSVSHAYTVSTSNSSDDI